MRSRRLIVCSDGTWQKITSPYPTNVAKITQAIVTDRDHLVFYGEGIGTGNFLDRIFGGAFGWGIDKNIQDAYRFLCLNYTKGDEIYLFGFSRGAYTVRSLVGLIRSVGILPRQGVRKIPSAYQAYQNAKGKYAREDETTREQTKLREVPEVSQFRQEMHAAFGDDYQPEDNVPIKLLCCWDTVGALGIPRFTWLPFAPLINQKYQFHNTTLSSTIEHALHAVAIDEHRKAFEYTQMKQSSENQLAEVWFPGGHACIGGGTQENSRLSDAALLWAIEQIEQLNLGLKFDRRKIQDGINTDPTINFNDIGNIPCFSKIRPIHGGAKLHSSVFKRWQLKPDYRPKNLIDYRDILDNAPID